jgi:hypothetical protein
MPSSSRRIGQNESSKDCRITQPDFAVISCESKFKNDLSAYVCKKNQHNWRHQPMRNLAEKPVLQGNEPTEA